VAEGIALKTKKTVSLISKRFSDELIKDLIRDKFRFSAGYV
jgi:hypothetical protein